MEFGLLEKFSETEYTSAKDESICKSYALAAVIHNSSGNGKTEIPAY